MVQAREKSTARNEKFAKANIYPSENDHSQVLLTQASTQYYASAVISE